ncbi:MAG: phosphatase PAP2 family protein [Clostridiales bacterium]|jgi:undecaprenyl-diphosphatase|nr:phosphatase PAP2 family protein [Clostridiales bacterium]
MFNEPLNIWLQNNFFDKLMQIVTLGGEELFFIAIGIAIYICVDKRFGLRLIYGYLLGAVINSALKLIFRIPRPYAPDPSRPDKELVPSIGPETDGYSFPSGHANAASLLAAPLCMRFGSKKRWWVYALGALVVAAVMFSRLYLGQHYLADVLVGALTGVLYAIAFKYLFVLMGDREHIFPLILIPIFILACVFSPENKDLFVVTGSYTGISVGYFIEKKYINASEKAVWWVQLIKLVFTIGIAVAIKEGFKLFLNPIISAAPLDGRTVVERICDLFRYLCAALWAAAGAFACIKCAAGFLKKRRAKKEPPPPEKTGLC